MDVDEVMAPFAREVLSRIVGSGQSLVLMIDQTQASVRHQVLMVSVRLGGRALPVAWQARRTSGAIGFSGQRDVLEAVRRLLPEGARPVLMGDRFYGSPDLIGRCRAWGWSYRLRLKGKVRATSRARTNTAYRVLAPQFTVAGTAAAIAARVSDTTNPDYSVRHEGARHQWRRDPPGLLSVRSGIHTTRC